jgi:hypothetical protein
VLYAKAALSKINERLFVVDAYNVYDDMRNG